jgi:protein-S-isoprenylcysteine O-methyltransferase Ste14
VGAGAGERGGGGAVATVAAAPLLVAGAGAYLWCLWDFATAGRGTPAPIDAPKRLVARGLYLYLRNPMYVAVLAVVTGWATYFADLRLLAYGALVAAVFHGFVVQVEEPSLTRRFGESYLRYRAEVPRWLPRSPSRRRK